MVGAIGAVISLFMNFFYHPDPPPTTIDSSSSEFLKLSYGDRVDRCAPYIASHIDDWRDKWRTALDKIGGQHQRDPVPAADVSNVGATGQALLNTHLAAVNYAEKLAPHDEGENLLSCLFSPNLKTDNRESVDLAALVGTGNNAPRADEIVVHESPLFWQGQFAGVDARGIPNKILEIVAAEGTPSEQHRELLFTMVSGYNKDHVMWSLAANVKAGDPAWKDNLEQYNGGG